MVGPAAYRARHGFHLLGRVREPEAGLRNAYGPSPPPVVHERGSHGCSASTGLVTASKPSGTVVVVVVGTGGAVVDAPAGCVVVVGGALGGALTAKSDPVTTVTWALSVVGPMAMTT